MKMKDVGFRGTGTILGKSRGKCSCGTECLFDGVVALCIEDRSVHSKRGVMVR